MKAQNNGSVRARLVCAALAFGIPGCDIGNSEAFYTETSCNHQMRDPAGHDHQPVETLTLVSRSARSPAPGR
jgi:hypothetical protein